MRFAQTDPDIRWSFYSCYNLTSCLKLNCTRTMAKFVILLSEGHLQTEDTNGFCNLKRTPISTWKVETVLILPVFYRMTVCYYELITSSLFEPLWLIWITWCMTQVQEKCSTSKCWQDLKEMGIALFYVPYKRFKVYSCLLKTNLITGSKKRQLMLFLNYFNHNWVTHRKTLFRLVIITHHSTTLRKTYHRLFCIAKLQQWNTFQSGTVNLELKQWYWVDTHEFGPPKHHAAAIQITSSV